MKESKLFQYAIFWQPTEEQEKTGERAKLIKEVETIVAKDEQSAFMIASRGIPNNYAENLDQVKIAVRPF